MNSSNDAQPPKPLISVLEKSICIIVTVITGRDHAESTRAAAKTLQEAVKERLKAESIECQQSTAQPNDGFIIHGIVVHETARADALKAVHALLSEMRILPFCHLAYLDEREDFIRPI